MATFGIDGLASGLDTTGIINQLIQLERQPQVRLEQRISNNDAAIASLQKFSSAFDNIETLSKALSGSAKNFVPVQASTSTDSVVATASPGAEQGSFTFTVDQLAATHRLVSGGTTAASTDIVATPDSTVRITVDGTDYDVDTGDGTLSSLIANINDPAQPWSALPVTAQAVNTGSGFKLQLTSGSSGADGTFTIDTTNLDATFAAGMPVLTQGRDAQVTIGDGPGAYAVTSGTNTFNDVISGVSFTVTESSSTPITLSIDADPDALVDQVSELVDAINSLITGMDQALDSGLEGTKGALSNDPTMRSLRTQLLNAVTYSVGNTHFQSAGLIGIESTRDGKLEFDETAFREALADRPDDVVAMFRSDDDANPGLAQRLESLASQATTLNTGLFATAIEARESTNRTMEDQIAAIDIRVELRRTALQRQFSALEVALSSMQAQGDWLTSQLPQLQANSAK